MFQVEFIPNCPRFAHNGTKQRIANVSLNARRPFVLDIFEAMIQAIALFFESIGHSSGINPKPPNRQPLPSKKHVT
jgi:hypothetical protein